MGHSDTEVAGERDVLVASLDDARHAVLAALTGVPVALLREPLIWPDGSLLAIVKHLTHLERWWFAHTFAGLDMRFPRSKDHPRADWRLESSDTAWSIVALYRSACAQSRLITERAGLSDVAARRTADGEPVALRSVVLQMIGETSRHAGQADVLRQLIDGIAESPPCTARDQRGRDHVPRLPNPPG